MDALAAAFAREHERTYGHAAAGDPIQVVNLRVTARLVRPAARRAGAARERAGGDGRRDAPRVLRAASTGRWRRRSSPARTSTALPRPGPLLIDEYDATTLVPPGATAGLDDHGNILIATGAPS